jgi:hypothetical protein
MVNRSVNECCFLWNKHFKIQKKWRKKVELCSWYFFNSILSSSFQYSGGVAEFKLVNRYRYFVTFFKFPMSLIFSVCVAIREIYRYLWRNSPSSVFCCQKYLVLEHYIPTYCILWLQKESNYNEGFLKKKITEVSLKLSNQISWRIQITD